MRAALSVNLSFGVCVFWAQFLVQFFLLGDDDVGGGDRRGGGREEELRRMPRHHHAHVAQRPDRPQGEFLIERSIDRFP